jgi:hypothetical protein
LILVGIQINQSNAIAGAELLNTNIESTISREIASSMNRLITYMAAKAMPDRIARTESLLEELRGKDALAD